MYSAKDLLSEFDTLSSADWLKAIEKYLKAKSFDELLLHLEGGAVIKPFYRKEDNNFIELPVLNSNNWLISEFFHYAGGDVNSFNKKLLNALMNGTESVNLRLEAGKPELLSDLLENVYLNMIELNPSGLAFENCPAEWLNELANLSDGAAKGCAFLSDSNQSLELLQAFNEKLPSFSFYNFQLSVDHNIIPSLSKLLREISNAFDSMLEKGFEADKAQSQINLQITLSEDYFLSIASIRAIKRLWLGLLEAYAVKTPVYPRIHAHTIESVSSADPYWNMISNTTQALSAAIAQVYSIEVRPTDNSEEKEIFSRRIARNVQHLLKMESHIDHIVDPSAGSYYIENYTAEIVKYAWGGFLG